MEQGGGSLLEVRPYIMRAAISGRLFGRDIEQPAVVGEFSRVQVFNPLASGVVAVVWFVRGSAGAESTILVSNTGAALATLLGPGFNLRFGGADAVSVLRRGSSASALTAAVDFFRVAANAESRLIMDGGIILNAGQDVILEGNVANTSLRGSFIWEEIGAL